MQSVTAAGLNAEPKSATAARIPWELLPAGRSPAVGPMLRVGQRAIPCSAVRGFVASAERGKDRTPAFATMAAFGSVAMFFLLGVIDVGWRPRFLVSSIVLGAIGIFALNDITWMTRSQLYQVEIVVNGGEIVRFTTIDPAQQAALIATLEKIIAEGKKATVGATQGASVAA